MSLHKAVYFNQPLRFITKNNVKTAEYKALLHPVEFIPIIVDTGDFAGSNHLEIVRSKTLKAFEIKRAPVFVEQTGLYLSAWDGLPGGLTELFWERLNLTGFLKLLENEENRQAVAITTIGYCDGRQIHIFEGKLNGTIASAPRGTNGIQWDPVFVPEGSSRTFAEMPLKEKLQISMRRAAAAAFKNFLLNEGRVQR